MTKDLPIYKITIDPQYSDGEDLAIEQIAFTSTPAIKVVGMAFDENKKMFFSDDKKYRVVAPAMIPMQIYRKDEDGEEYYVQFSEEVIEELHSKFMKDLRNRDIFNLEHNTSKTVPAYVLEAWIVEDPKKDKAYSSYNIEVPKGTLMITAQVTDKDYYEELVKNEQIGFSIEGFLGLKLSNQLNKYHMKLPDGEHQIEDKIYIVKDGEVIEIKDVEAAEIAAEEIAAEEVAMDETIVEEEEMEKPATEEMAIDPATDSETILAIIQPLLTEHENKLLALIADLRNYVEEVVAERVEEVEASEVKLSLEQKFSALSKFLND